jgi:hypothetical protein
MSKRDGRVEAVEHESHEDESRPPRAKEARVDAVGHLKTADAKPVGKGSGHGSTMEQSEEDDGGSDVLGECVPRGPVARLGRWSCREEHKWGDK